METKALSASRRTLPLLLITLVLSTAACRSHHRDTVKNEEQAEVGPRIASTLKMSDAPAPAQLLRGFYSLESGAWRWTAGNFTVLLRPPLASAQRGAVLTFAFTIPDVVIEKLKSVTLTASLSGTKLKSQTFSKPGPFTFTTDIAPELLAKDAVTIDFTLDKSLPAGTVDQRELGIIATAVGLESK